MFQDRIEEILEDEERAFMKDLRSRCRRVMDEAEADTAIGAVEMALNSASNFKRGLVVLLFNVKFAEELAPRILSGPEPRIPEGQEAQITWLAQKLKASEDEVREVFDSMSHMRTWIQKAHNALPSRDRRWLERRLVDLMDTRMSMCAVVHL